MIRDLSAWLGLLCLTLISGCGANSPMKPGPGEWVTFEVYGREYIVERTEKSVSLQGKDTPRFVFIESGEARLVLRPPMLIYGKTHFAVESEEHYYTLNGSRMKIGPADYMLLIINGKKADMIL